VKEVASTDTPVAHSTCIEHADMLRRMTWATANEARASASRHPRLRGIDDVIKWVTSLRSV
jgi:hypothetical protein